MYEEKDKAAGGRLIQQIFNQGEPSSIGVVVSHDSLHHEIGDVAIPSGHGLQWFADMLDAYGLAFPDLQVEIQDQTAEETLFVPVVQPFPTAPTQTEMPGSPAARLKPAA